MTRTMPIYTTIDLMEPNIRLMATNPFGSTASYACTYYTF